MPKIVKAKLAETVIDEIKNMLRNGELKEGDRLPNQGEFAKYLGVSRLSLREALNILEMIGVIKQKPRVGTVIVSGNPDLWINHTSPPLFSDTKNVKELLEARRIIELSMARLTIKNITVNDLEILENYIHIMSEAAEQNESENYQAADIEFHTRIAASCDNRYLNSMFIYVYNMMGEFMKEFFEIMPSFVKDSLKMHRQVFQSLKDRDEKKFLQSLTAHLEQIEIYWKNYYGSK